MTTIRYPVPFEMRAKYGRSRSVKTLIVSHEIEIDIPDVDPIETVLCLSADLIWTPSRDLPFSGVVPLRHPLEIRHYGEHFYAPVRMFSTIQSDQSVEAKPEDLALIGSSAYSLTTAFEKIGSHIPPHHLFHLQAQNQGRLQSIQDADVKLVETSFQHEQEEQASTFCRNFIALDGRLFVRMPGEPKIFYSRKLDVIKEGGEDHLKPRIVMEIAQHGRDNLFRQDFDHGYFRATELSDCIDFINRIYPEVEIQSSFENLRLFGDEYFKGQIENEELISVARRLVQFMMRQSPKPYFLEEGGSTEAIQRLISELQFGTGADCDIVASAIQELQPYFEAYDQYRKINPVLSSTIERWNLRPISSSNFTP